MANTKAVSKKPASALKAPAYRSTYVKNRPLYLIAAFLIPALLTFIAYALFGVYPFNGRSVLTLDLNGQYVYYFEANESRVFAYCRSEVYEIKYKLYELEEMYTPLDFVRCSKSMIVNMEKIEYLSPLFSGKLEAHLKNGEKIVISRQYVHNLKIRLGIEEVES